MNITIPIEIQRAIERGATFALSTSGGKDSQAMMRVVVDYLRSIDYPKELFFAIHADLGRMEWFNSAQHIDKICNDLDVPLVVVRREKGDLLDRFQERMAQLEGKDKPFWASPKARYCTSDLKTRPIDQYLRQFTNVVNVMGLRANESKNRAKKPCVETRESLQTRSRTAINWLPIHPFSVADVFATYGNTLNDLNSAREQWHRTKTIAKDWRFHPAYAMGNERLSCALCIMGSLSDLQNGIRYNPELAETLISMEKESGFSFQMNRSLDSVQKGLQNVDWKLF